MTAIAVGTLVHGLTATQALDVAAAAVQIAEQAGINVGAMTIRAHADWHAEIQFQPKDAVGRELAALFGLGIFTNVDAGTPHLATLEGDWFGARLVVLCAIPVVTA